MKKIILIGGIILLVLLGIRIYHANTVFAPPDIRGAITNVTKTESKDVLGFIMVEGSLDKDTSFDKASITVTKQTKIFQMDQNQNKTKITFDDVKTGQTTEVVFTGPVRESYPVQADALEIRIMK